MDRQARADATEKTLASVIGMVVLLAGLMAVFVFYFLKNEDSYQQVALTSAMSTFASQVAIIHSQWLLTHQPETVIIVERDQQQNKQQRQVKVNRLGWPDNDDSAIPCQQIWRQVMAQPLQILNTPVSAVQVKQGSKSRDVSKICRYFLTDQLFFEYNSGKGEVITAN